jgi:hypothetical protein
VLEVEEVLVVKIEKIKEWKKGKQPETQQGKDTQKLKTVKNSVTYTCCYASCFA